MMRQTLLFTLIPVAAMIGGGVVAAFRPPGPQLRSVIQHFAAGVVFAAAAGEVLPDILHQESVLAVIFGFVVGVGVMLLLKRLTTTVRGPASLLATLGVDIFIDGLLIGIGFIAGASTGLLLTLALALEVTFLGLSASVAMEGSGPSRKILTSVGLAALLPLGAAFGVGVFGQAPGPIVAGVLSFGLVALLYLVTEELLVEAHEVADTPAATAMFFAGFLALLLLEEFVRL